MNKNMCYNGLKFKFYASTSIEKDKNKGRIIIGYAATSDLDRQGDVISPQALKNAVKDLKENTTVFYEHKHDSYPIGKILNTGVDDNGLWIEVLVSKTANDIWTLIEEGILNKFSIGGKVINSKKIKDKEKEEYNLITDIELYEVSIVGLPANPGAEFEQVKSIISCIQKAYKRKEVLQEALNKIEEKPKMKKNDLVGGEKMSEKKIEKKDIKINESVEKKEEKKVEEKLVENKEEKSKPKKVEEKEKKTEENIEVTKKEEITKEEIEEIVDEEKELKDNKEVELFEIALSEELCKKLDEIKSSIDELTILLKNKDANKEEKKDILDEKKIEEIIVKALDAKLGKIRLVPTRKGTIIKLTSEEEDKEQSNNVDVLYDEEKFNSLSKPEQVKIKRAGWKHIIQR